MLSGELAARKGPGAFILGVGAKQRPLSDLKEEALQSGLGVWPSQRDPPPAP